MAVREYIGARYVPIFVGEWDVNATYEPLSIVTVANVGSYTSKKYVPAGVAITDTDYWAESANLSGQITALTNRVNDLEDYDVVVNDFILNQNRRVVLISDSFGVKPSSTQSWPYYVSQIVDGISYVFQIQQNGMGYYRPGHEATTYYNSVKSSIVDMDTITDIVCLLGQNDSTQSPVDVRNAAYNFYNELHTDMPNARIWTGYGQDMISGADSTLANLVNLIPNLEAVASRCNFVSWMSGLEYIMHDTANLDSGDPGHPTQSGSLWIARGIASYMNGGTFKYSFSTETTVDWGNGDTSNALVIMDGPVCTIKLGQVTKTGTVALNSNNWVKVGELGSCRIRNRSALTQASFVRDMGSSGRSAIVNIDVKTDDKDIYFHIYAGSETITPSIPDLNLVLPTMIS